MTCCYRFFRGAAFALVIGLGIVRGAAAAEGGTAAPPGGLAWDFWVPRAELTPREQRLTPPFCRGAYRWPAFPVLKTGPLEEEPIEAEARSLQYWESGAVYLDGEVVVTRGERTLTAPRVELNHITRDALVPDRVQIQQPDLILRGAQGEMNMDTKATLIQDAEFLLIEPEFRGEAERIERFDSGDMKVTRGYFTRCEPDSKGWRIGSRSFSVRDGSDFGVARHAVVRVRNVPVFYTPYLSFPVNDERKSGWLFPSLGFSSLNGVEFAPPYYLNLAPNYDATLVPRYFQKRGWGAEGEFRHLSRWQESRLVGSFLGKDKQYDGVLERDDFDRLEEAGLVQGPFEPADRWLYGAYHKGDLGPWRTTLNYTAVSDRDYFRNLNTQLSVASRRELLRFGEIQYANRGLDVRLWAQRYQRLDEVLVDPYRRVPELALTYNGYLPGPLEWSIGASGAMFDRQNSDLTGSAKIVGSRVHVEPRLRLPLSRSWGFFTLTGGYRYTSYDLEDTAPEVEKSPERKIALGSADMGLYFERSVNLFGRQSLQTLEPRIYYLYQQYRDQDDLPLFDVSQLTFYFDQLWRDNRFSGIDRIGDANQFSVGLTSRLLDASSGSEYLRASIGQIRYLADRRVTLGGVQYPLDLSDESELAGELVASFRHWSLGVDTIWDPTIRKISRGGGYASYRSDNDHIFHVGYRYQRAAINQLDWAFMWPVSKRFSVVGRWNYDLDSNETIEGLAGIEYNDCCWKLRLVARNYLDTPSARFFADAKKRTGVFFQVVFKGLASLDDSVENLLSESIRGYVMEEG